MWEGPGSGFYCFFPPILIRVFTVLNWEDPSVWDGIFCQMPLMLLCPGALEILERLSFCWCVSEGKKEVRLGLRDARVREGCESLK